MKTPVFPRVACFAFLLPNLHAQVADVRGIVTDSLTNQRVPFVNIVLVGTNKGAAANGVGFYLLPSVQAGAYEIAASAVGYERLVRRITVQVGRTLELNFRLKPTAIETEEVVVTGKGKKELTEINTSIHIVDQQELKITPVAAQADVFHSLKMLPGIVSTSDVSSKFYVRGGAGDQNLVLLDGMKIYNPFHALGIFSVFDPDIVRNVEIYTGAFPPGFGSRLSSVVNINSGDGRADRLAGRANINFLSSKLQLEGPLASGVTWSLNGRKSLFKETFKDIVQQDVPVDFYDLFVKVSGQTEGEAKFDLSYLTTADDLKYPNPNDPDYRWRNTAMGLNVSGLLSDRLFVTSTVFANSFTAERDAKSSNLITPSTTSVKEPGVRAQATYYTDEQDLYFFGFEFSFPTLEYNLTNNTGTRVHLYTTSPEASAWIRYQAKYGRLQLDGGIHSEVGSLFDRGDASATIQPRINLSYLVIGDWRVKASYGRFSQNVITVSNEDDLISVFDAWIEVPDNLETEQADHFVGGFEGTVADRTSASIQAYYKNYGSLAAYNRNKIDANDPDYITGTGKAYGMELLLRYGSSLLDLYGTYTIGWTKLNNEGLEYYPRYDRRHHINLLGVVRPFERFDITLRWEFGSGFPFTQTVGFYDRLTLRDALPGPFELETGQPYNLLGPKNAARLPDYHRLDASVNYTLALGALRAIIGVNIINLYDQKNVFYFDRRTGQRVDMLGFFPTATLTLEY
ncbi:MAG: TonB-dependent receptor [Bacteroidota bacterium]